MILLIKNEKPPKLALSGLSKGKYEKEKISGMR
jgi:hypothetical protein